MAITLLIVATILNIALGIFVYFSSKREKNKSITLSFFTWAIAMWSLFNALFQITQSEVLIFLWSLLAYTAGSFMVYFMHLFALAAVNFKISVKFYNKLILILSVVIPYIPDFVITRVDLANRTIETGMGVYILFASYVYFILITINIFYRGMFTNFDKERSKVLLVFVSTISLVIIGSVTNIVLPSYGNYSMVAYGPLLTLLFLIMITYAISRYRLFDVRVFTGRILYFVLVGSIPFVMFVFAGYVEKIFSINIATPLALILLYVFGVIFVFIYNYANQFIRDKVNSAIINPGFDPFTEINRYSREISSLTTLEQVIEFTFKTLKKTVRPESTLIVLLDSNKSFQKSVDNKTQIDAYQISKIIDTIKTIPRLPNFLDVDELMYIEERELPALKNNLIKVVIPIRKDGVTVAYILLGEKNGGYMYNSIEQKFVVALIDSLQIAIDRSALYQEVRDFNLGLQEKIEIATKELKLKNNQLEDALKKERDMMDILGHELRTPLGTARNAIVMIQNMIKKNQFSKKKSTRLIEIAIDNIRREKDALQTILSSARIENDRIPISPEVLKVQEIFKDILESHKKDALNKGLKIHVDIEPDKLQIYVDKSIIQQILDNFISNAIKYTATGTVTLFARLTKEGTVSVGVTDTGEGISSENIKRLGKKFYRINPYSDGKLGDTGIVRPGGTGIGLYVVKGLLKAMDTELFVTSELGKGSTFSFSVQKATEQNIKQKTVTTTNTSGDVTGVVVENSAKEKISKSPTTKTIQKPQLNTSL